MSQIRVTHRLDDVVHDMVNVLLHDLALVDDGALTRRLDDFVLDGVQREELVLVLVRGGVRLCEQGRESDQERTTERELLRARRRTADLRSRHNLLVNLLRGVLLVEDRLNVVLDVVHCMSSNDMNGTGTRRGQREMKIPRRSYTQSA